MSRQPPRVRATLLTPARVAQASNAGAMLLRARHHCALVVVSWANLCGGLPGAEP